MYNAITTLQNNIETSIMRAALSVLGTLAITGNLKVYSSISDSTGTTGFLTTAEASNETIIQTGTTNTSIGMCSGTSGYVANLVYMYCSGTVIKASCLSNGAQMTSGATAWAFASDERLKDILGYYENPLEDIKQIKACNSKWKVILMINCVSVFLLSLFKI